MTVRNTVIEGLDELLTEQKAKFDELEANISQLTARAEELEGLIAGRGSESLEAVQANSADKLELDQVNEVLSALHKKRSTMIEEGSTELLRKLQGISGEHRTKISENFRDTEEAQVRSLWQQIKDLTKQKAEQESEEYGYLNQNLQQFKKYLNDEHKNSLERMNSFYGMGSNYVERIKDGWIN